MSHRRSAATAFLRLPLTLAVLMGPVTAPATSGEVIYTDVSREAGILFNHVIGASGEKYYVETMGSGACWFDADNDEDIDLYVVNSAPLPGYRADGPIVNHLYLNDGDGTFTDVTSTAGVGEPSYGMGCAVGDVDNDGDLDLYVTNFGDNVLYLNDGKARFKDVTAESGVRGATWSASAAFADIDNDGDLDLYVTRYLDFALNDNRYCGQRKPGFRAYCHPDEYNGLTDFLFRNRGDGRFEDVSAAAGIANPLGKGLGVVFTDINDDGWQDIYVANDMTTNLLYLNQKNGTFRDVSLAAGTGFSTNGAVQAGMGTDSGDLNGDGRLDIIVTNLDFQTNELYFNIADQIFTNATFQAGLGQPNFLHVGFGVDLLDYDNDMDKDILIVNGHILDNIGLTRDEVTYEQSRSMLQNDGSGRFTEIAPRLGKDFSSPNVGRGLAVGDMDNDGDLDFFVVNSNRQGQLLRNDGGAASGHWILIRLEGTRSNSHGIGARVRIATSATDGSTRWQAEDVKSGSSYCSSNDVRVHFGLGEARRIDRIEVRWPSGVLQTLEKVEGDQILTIREPSGE